MKIQNQKITVMIHILQHMVKWPINKRHSLEKNAVKLLVILVLSAL
jgi:hypothetical protein